jgi:cytochrome c oxidase subunit 3
LIAGIAVPPTLTKNKTGEPTLDERTPPPEGYRIAIWLALVSITMLFLALTSAYIFNRANTHPIVMPRVLWLSTALIIGSSLTIELARRSLRLRREGGFKLWLAVTMALGLGFLGAQITAWQYLVESGFYINRNFYNGQAYVRNFHSSYAYIFTGLHGVHLLGGLFALAFLIARSQEKWTAVRRRVSVDATALYWHFLDGLWIYLLALLFFWK